MDNETKKRKGGRKPLGLSPKLGLRLPMAPYLQLVKMAERQGLSPSTVLRAHAAVWLTSERAREIVEESGSDKLFTLENGGDHAK